MKKLFVVDALGYLFRSYYAIRNLSRKTGESTNALYGFIRALLKLQKDFSPTHLVVVFDGKDNAKSRLAIYPEYKKNRLHPPEDLPHQFEWAYQFCEIAKIPLLRVDGTEADDTMASLALWAESKGSEVYLCTSDKDLFQLVNSQIFVLNTHKNNLILDPKGVKEHFGVWPSQVLDYLSIVGDSSDNVPGIKSFGPKTAQALLEKAKTLDELLKNPEAYLTGKKKDTFLSQLDQLSLSKRLVTLFTDISIPKDIDFYELKEPNFSDLSLFYEDMNFNSLLKETTFSSETSSSPIEAYSTKLIQDEVLLDQLIERLQQETDICIDTETTGLDRLNSKIVGLGLAAHENETYYIPFNDRLEKKFILDKLRPLFENPSIGFYGHHLKYDLHLLANEGISVQKVSGDTMLLSYLLTPQDRRHSLDELAQNYLSWSKISIESLIGSGKNQKSMKEVPLQDIAKYCGEDLIVTMKLKVLLEEKLKEKDLFELYQSLELPLIQVLLHMERAGIYIDIPLLEEMKKSLNVSLKKIEEEAYVLAGGPFNLKSPKQLGELLFEKLQIPPPKKTKTGYSTNAESLELIQEAHPIVDRILHFRLLEKLRSTYVESLIHEVNPNTHRIHCNFNQTITATGRLSCQNPNLQNIPIKTSEGKEIRAAFQPQKEDALFLSADYSQIELRLLAHLSEDPLLIETFLNREDVHSQTASKIFNIPLDQVTKNHRYLAKAVNFGILYGQQAFGLSKQLKISVSEAKSFIDTYFERYQKVKDYLEYAKEKARSLGFAETLFGRKRPLEEINSKNKLLQQAAERLAVNSPIQGTNADIIKLAMIQIDLDLKHLNLGSKMLLQIHDELLFEMPKAEEETLKKCVQSRMEGVVTLKVPLIVDIKIGKNWKEC